MFVHPAQVAELGKRHPELGRLRLVVSRQQAQDVMVLHAECGATGPALEQALAASLQALTNLHGGVRLVEPGSLPNDGRIIADERPQD
jgi:phenylacetate-CoA ligase